MSPPSFLGALLFAVAAHGLPAAETVKVGQFEAQLAEDNGWLPSSIRWVKGDVELLRPETGLNLSFTSFECRNKFYHEENRNIWKGRNEPRFVADAKVLGREACHEGDFSGTQVSLESTYARIRRRLLFHASESRVRLVYALELTRDVVLHEANMLAVGIQFHEGFDQFTVPDARDPEAPPLTASGWKNPSHSAGFHHAGPRLLANAARRTALLVLDSHSGDGLERPAVNLLLLKKGQRMGFTVELLVAPMDDPVVKAAFNQAAARMPAADRPFLLVADAQVLAHQGNFKDAEAALRESARLAPEYATPFGVLAAICRDHKLPGEAAAWLEAGYRMPYNYGYMLSGSGWFNEPGLTEEQRRQHIFNILVAVENNVFYPDYYLWAARGFLKLGMKAQVCAMYRQALWAVDFMPRGEDTRQKLRAECRKQLSELEESLRAQPRTKPPPPAGPVFSDPSLPEDRRHLGVFDVLVGMEGATFNPDSVLWAAEGFRKMEMPVQACAMYRQALWAVEDMPCDEETRRKWRGDFRKRISELEEVLKGQTVTHLPPMIPVRLPAK